MTVLIGPFHTLLVVLFLSGTDKLVRPDGAARAMRSAKLVPGVGLSALRRSRLLARSLGATEVGLAIAPLAVSWLAAESSVLAISAALAVAVAVMFVGFVWFVVRLTAQDSTAGCGCFGVASVPPGTADQLFNLAAAAIAVSSAAVVNVSSASLGLGPIADHGVSVAALYGVVVAAAAVMFLVGPSLLTGLKPPEAVHDSGVAHSFRITEGLSR